jgi:lipopolysaccharide/colanic/teichoic acid biosynthesis glycosyltransferase
LSDAVRLTKVGWFVRSTSIDELPQFINVFEGNMSLIGSRPLLKKYMPFTAQSRFVATKSVPVLPAGRSATDAMPSAGPRNFN